ncbi:MAG: hypothetical protein HY821_13820 [Acidobacteria bacterium]|nr:hypothetical protein [Acidobacteriota bacterium]
MRPWQTWLFAARLCLLALLVWLVLDGLPYIVAWRERTYGAAPRKAAVNPYDWVDPAKALGIINFYASPAAIRRGEFTSLCYGVMNAASVAIDPPVEKLTPALNRCFQVNPSETTRYTLTVTDKRGATLSKSFTLPVSAR